MELCGSFPCRITLTLSAYGTDNLKIFFDIAQCRISLSSRPMKYRRLGRFLRSVQVGDMIVIPTLVVEPINSARAGGFMRHYSVAHDFAHACFWWSMAWAYFIFVTPDEAVHARHCRFMSWVLRWAATSRSLQASAVSDDVLINAMLRRHCPADAQAMSGFFILSLPSTVRGNDEAEIQAAWCRRNDTRRFFTLFIDCRRAKYWHFQEYILPDKNFFVMWHFTRN